MQRRIVATGGAGFIGSHVTVALLEAGYDVTILDNFSNAPRDIADRIARTGAGTPEVIELDCRDAAAVDAAFAGRKIDAVIHLAGKKAVAESVADPLLYYDWNVVSAMTVLQAMQNHGIARFVFSSSATVYGAADIIPTPETAPTHPENPYGQTKRMIEQIIQDHTKAHPDMSAISLRYFNPVGAHHSGHIGERGTGIPANLFPYITQTITGLRPMVQVFGDDYETPDGTGVRDYIHVCDLARGHVCAVDHMLQAGANHGHQIINLGTGTGYSVLDVLAAFQQVCGHDIPHKILPRRAGDVPFYVADPSLAHSALGWQAQSDLVAMCRDHLHHERKQ